MFSGQDWLVLPHKEMARVLQEPGLMKQENGKNQCSSLEVGEATVFGINWLSRSNVVLVHVYRHLVYILLINFSKKQIMCFTRKS